MGDNEPYLSFVVTARNDDHGGDLLRRMQIFVSGLLEQAAKYGLSVELILVEWNPVADRPRLHQVLSWPRKEGLCKVRVIEVPSGIHKRFRHSDRLALFQMIAKNVGIRRARGRFVLATNVDLLFSNELIRFLASRSLNPNFIYRIDRYDVSADVPNEAPIEDQLAYCQHNVIRVNRRDGTFPSDALHLIRLRKVYKRLISLCRYFSVFLPSWPRLQQIIDVSGTRRLAKLLAQILSRVRRAFHNLRHLNPKMILILPYSGLVMLYQIRFWLSISIFALRLWQLRARWLWQHMMLTSTIRLSSLKWRMMLSMNLLTMSFVNCWIPVVRWIGVVKHYLFPPYPRLHTNGCGDFTLMAREHWHTLRGYPELEMFSFNLDSVLCHMAHQLGLREKVLPNPMRIYHIEHSSGWTPEREHEMKERLRITRIPTLDFEQFEFLATRMQREKRPLDLNKDEWGLTSDNLPEMTVDAQYGREALHTRVSNART